MDFESEYEPESSDNSESFEETGDILESTDMPDLEISEDSIALESDFSSELLEDTDMRGDSEDVMLDETSEAPTDLPESIEEIPDLMEDDSPEIAFEDLSQEQEVPDEIQQTTATDMSSLGIEAENIEEDTRSIEELAQPAQEINSLQEMRQDLWENVNDQPEDSFQTFTPEFLAETEAIDAQFEQEESERLSQIEEIQAEVFDSSDPEPLIETTDDAPEEQEILQPTEGLGNVSTSDEASQDFEKKGINLLPNQEVNPIRATDDMPLDDSSRSPYDIERIQPQIVETEHGDYGETFDRLVDEIGRPIDMDGRLINGREIRREGSGSGERLGKSTMDYESIQNFTHPTLDLAVDTTDVLSAEQDLDRSFWESDVVEERLEGNLNAFSTHNWDSISLDEKKFNIQQLSDTIAQGLQVEVPPEIEFYEEASGEMGYSSEGVIGINTHHLEDPSELADTIAHEMRHHWQREQTLDPNSELGQAFQENFDNYISPHDDYEAYEQQLVEADAREFAQQIKNRVK